MQYVYVPVEVYEDGLSFNLGFYETLEEAQKVVEAFDLLKKAGSTVVSQADYMWVQSLACLTNVSNQTVEGVHD